MVYVAASVVRVFLPCRSSPSLANEIGPPPFTWKLKSVAFLVPPLPLTTSFLTIKVPAWSLLVMVQRVP